MGHVDFRRGLLRQVHLSNALHHADNLARKMIPIAPPAIAYPKPLSQGILVGKHLTGERFVDDDNQGGIGCIAFREIAAVQQRNAHGTEILRRDQAVIGSVLSFRKRRAAEHFG